jgi:hypothetical protein
LRGLDGHTLLKLEEERKPNFNLNHRTFLLNSMSGVIPPSVLDKILNGSIVPELYFSNDLPGGTRTGAAPPGTLTNLIVNAGKGGDPREFNLLVIKRIIDTQPKEVTRRSKRNDVIGTKATPGFLPIHYAAERGRLDVIKLLLNARFEDKAFYYI